MTDDDIDLANVLADAAGDAIRPFFRTRLDVEDKADASPVTQADRAAEAAMRAILAVKRPGDGVIGEEYGADRPDAARVWVLDPIDGTRSFIAGRPIFGTLIALLEEARPVLGVIDQPIGAERWIGAHGRPTTLNDVPAKVRACPTLDRALLATTGPSYFDAAGLVAFERVSAGARETMYAGDCYNYGLLASGHIDLVVEAGLKLHDFAALVPVVEGAGGGMCDWTGAPLGQASDGRVIALGDVRLLDEVLARLG
ncbi:histidinol-phosphatase [Sphingomonas jatrophae]|uniref:Histidinol-phosphatase n=1 Tax=Sphingomonas jatrophae TaxID=1166337 RepID=A0A1I6LQS3_9SPHN|nr:histidinol-phosphatase [Sphingomonas jatrophae]SFS05602.1 histidinol-phosphatase, inositol monophosphatase family [Sphingomonas jatrophae]